MKLSDAFLKSDRRAEDETKQQGFWGFLSDLASCIGCGFIGFLLLAGGFWLFLWWLCHVAPGAEVDEEFEDISALMKHPAADYLPVSGLLPAEARKIKIWGDCSFFGSVTDFTCEVTEDDFIKFASACGYALQTNQIANANPLTNTNEAYKVFENIWNEEHPRPEHFYSYLFVSGGCGSTSLVFNPDTGILWGFFSDH